MHGDPNPIREPRTTAIRDLLVQELGWYDDQRGGLSVLLRGEDGPLRGQDFGQAYITTVLPGVVKAWHRHERQWDRMVGLSGRTLLALVDGRERSPSHGALVEIIFGDHFHGIVLIPPGVWHGLKNLGPVEATVLNLPTLPYDVDQPDELRHPAHSCPVAGATYSWERQDG